MKNFVTYLFCLILFTTNLFCQSCGTCTSTLSSGSVDLSSYLNSSSNNICITGNVTITNANNLGEGNDKICISAGGSLTWSAPNINSGSLIINVLPGSTLNENSGYYNGRITINNGGDVNFTNGITMQGNPGNTINNFSGATVNVTNNITLSQNSTVNNLGTFNVTNNFDIAEGTFSNTPSGSLAVANELHIHSDNFFSSSTITAGSLRFTNKAGDGPEFAPGSTTTITGNIYVDATVILNGTLETLGGNVTFTSNGHDNGPNGHLIIGGNGISTIEGGGYYKGTVYDADNNGGYVTTPGSGVTAALHGFDIINIQSPSQNQNNITVLSSLPVTFTKIKAEAREKTIVVSWSTASELNNKTFEVMRSIDGEKFVSIAKVEGGGTTHEERHYTFEDTDISNAQHFYKIKQVDFDGKYEYSTIVSAKIYFKSPIAVFPNPTLDHIFLTNIDQDIVYLYDCLGKLVLSQNVINNAKIDLSQLKAGMYFLKFSAHKDSFSVIKN